MSQRSAQSATPLTRQQANVVAARAPKVAVTASAGTGKTRVLTERYLAALDELGLEAVPGIVALTFTRKAARELRERVRRACRERYDLAPGAVRTQRFQIDLEAAPIATFHSYCGSLLRRYPVEAGVEPGFRELDESVAQSYREVAVRNCLEQWLANEDPGFMRLACAYGIDLLSKTLITLVREHGHDFAITSVSSADAVIELWSTVHRAVALPEALRDLAGWARPRLAALTRIPARSKRVNEKVQTLIEFLSRSDGVTATSTQLVETREAALLKNTRATDWESETDQQRYKACFGTLAERLKGLIESCDHNPAITRAMAERSLELARLRSEVSERYDALKRAAGVLDFDDLQRHTLRLLREGPEQTRAQIRSSIRLVLVDEFQDTDTLQAKILESLTRDSDASHLVVGDVKQSIYGFRGARPELFEDLGRSIPAMHRHRLTENFRSSPSIVHFVNSVFKDVFSGDDYHLIANRQIGDASQETPVLLRPCHGLLDGKTPVAARRSIEARSIARYVSGMLASGWLVWDTGAHLWRNAHAGDVALLFRTTNDMDVYQSAFAALGIDTHVVGGRTFFSQQEVIDLVNVLRVVENPYDELALAGVLRAPYFGVDDEGLLRLSTSDAGGIVEGFWRPDTVGGLGPRNRTRVERARRLLQSWRDSKDTAPIARLVDRVLDESGIEDTVSLTPLGDQKFANLRKLVRLAAEFDAQGGLSLADFVQRLRGDLEGNAREELGVVSEEQGTSVRLMTIHQAKGLEFPIVVLPDLDRSEAFRRDSVDCHDVLGLIPRPADDLDRDEIVGGAPMQSASCIGLGDAAFQLIERTRARQEANRLLYVAMTRARDHLVVSTTLTAQEEARSAFGTLLFSTFDRETGQCLVECPKGWPEARLHVADDNEPPLDAPVARSTTRLSARWIAAARAIEEGFRHGAQDER